MREGTRSARQIAGTSDAPLPGQSLARSFARSLRGRDAPCLVLGSIIRQQTARSTLALGLDARTLGAQHLLEVDVAEVERARSTGGALGAPARAARLAKLGGLRVAGARSGRGAQGVRDSKRIPQ